MCPKPKTTKAVLLCTSISQNLLKIGRKPIHVTPRENNFSIIALSSGKYKTRVFFLLVEKNVLPTLPLRKIITQNLNIAHPTAAWPIVHHSVLTGPLKLSSERCTLMTENRPAQLRGERPTLIK